MKHEKSFETYVATPLNVVALDVATEVLGSCNCSVDDDFKVLKSIFLAHDSDLNELAFEMSELYSRKQIETPSRAFKVKVSVIVEELKGKK